MCAVTLTVIPICKHELATIDRCADAPILPAYEHSSNTNKHKTYTASLGFAIWQQLDAPVTCSACKLWLTMHYKYTAGGIATDEPNTKAKKDKKDDEPGAEDDKKDDLAKLLSHTQNKHAVSASTQRARQKGIR